MSNIDLFEIEHKVHQWLSRLSVAAMHQNWGTVKTDVQKFGLSNDAKIQLGQYIYGSLLDESSAIALQTRASVWEHVFEQFAAYVTKNDFPPDCFIQKEKKKTLKMENTWGCLCQWYVQELNVRSKIDNHVATRLENDRKNSRYKM